MLQNQIKNLPNKPGIYKFYDNSGRLLYIGKAKSLKNRVKSYFKFSPQLSPAKKLSLRIEKMINEANSLEYFLVDNENDALILENSLIKQLKPKYNILLRDDKTYPYIYVDLSLDFPRFEITRKIVKGKKIRYFGPFSSSVKDLFNSIYLLLPLVQKKNCQYGKKACLFYQIKRCKAPCEGKISMEEYRKIVDQAIIFLNDKSQIISKLKTKMSEYAKLENYEQAALIRDQIRSVENLSQATRMDFASLEDFDVFAISIQGNIACCIRMFIRNGKMISSMHNLIKISEIYQNDFNDLYKQMILDFYPKNSPMIVKTILCAHDFEDKNVIEDILSQLHNKSIYIKIPKIGEKRHLCDLAIVNANELINKYKFKNESNLLDEIYKDLSLENFPNTIEIFDNSHLSQEANVGAMVVWEENKFNKTKYRHYHLDAKDEYGQMKEMLTRRVEKFSVQGPPDLWVIDGGKTLLSLAVSILQSYGVNIDVIAIAKEKQDSITKRAKGKANDKLHTKDMDFQFSSFDKRLHFFQKLRDEAHRFAITFHRKTKRTQDMKKSNLVKKGFTNAQIKKLLDYFGDFENIQKAPLMEIKNILNKKT